MIYKTCLMCGEEVKIELDLLNECAICKDCRTVFLEMKKRFKQSEESKALSPRECIIKFTDDDGNVFYMGNTSNTPKYISADELKNHISFTSNMNKAHKYTKTRADKICRCIYELQNMDLYTFIVKAEVIRDGKTIIFREYKKENSNV